VSRGDEIKAQFVRAIIAGCEAIWDVCPQAPIVHTDPIIYIIADPRRPQDRLAAENYRQSMFASWDMIAGRSRPELGGKARYLDLLGVNFYIHNQWIHNDAVLVPSHPQHLPLRYMLREVYERYSRPLFISETGIEANVRPDWLRYVGHEARAAMRLGVPLQGICIYPVVDHPGWEDERYCPNGLWGYANDRGDRETFRPLALELERQQGLLSEMREPPEKLPAALGPGNEIEALEEIDWKVLNAAAHNMDELTSRSRE
jgi:polysaccharide biosynthesis protein PelF